MIRKRLPAWLEISHLERATWLCIALCSVLLFALFSARWVDMVDTVRGARALITSANPTMQTDALMAHSDPDTPGKCRMYAAAARLNPARADTVWMHNCLRHDVPGASVIVIALAIVHLERGQVEEASLLLRRYPEVEQFMLTRAQSFIGEDRADEALLVVEAMEGWTRWPSEILTLKAEALRMQGDRVSAEYLYRESLLQDSFSGSSLNTGRYRTLHSLGRLLQQQGRWAEAEEYFQQAVEVNPESFSAWLFLGISQYHRGELDASYEALERSLALRQTDLALMHQGKTLHAAGDTIDAVDRWWRAYLFNNNNEFLREFVVLEDTVENAAIVLASGLEAGAVQSDFALLGSILGDVGMYTLSSALIRASGVTP